MGPVRDLGAAIASVKLERIRPIRLNDFYNALQVGSDLGAREGGGRLVRLCQCTWVSVCGVVDMEVLPVQSPPEHLV